jgi:hypothetical protein
LTLAASQPSVTDDVPADVEAVLTQLLAEAEEAFERDDVETAVAELMTASEVATNKLPQGDLRSRLLHGCEQAEAVATSEDGDTAVAAEYVAAMARRLDDASG